jgi:adenylate cyclase
MLFVWYFSQSLTRPIEELQEAAAKIEDGYYQIKLRNKNRDETGVLTRSVISMNHALANFERLTNKAVARLARQGKLPLGGAEKEATVFFSDIRSFTAISEKLKPEEVVNFLNAYLELMVRCILATGGAIDKFIGDAIFAHWGAVPQINGVTPPPEENARACLRTALLMRAALASFNLGRGSAEKPVIRIGCALNSGSVAAGQVGSEERLEFTIIGDTVSLADRTEGFNKVFGTEILITENTWKLVKNGFIFVEMPAIKDQGKSLRMFTIINARGEESEWLFKTLSTIEGIDMPTARRVIGPQGPHTLADLRKLLHIPTPDLSKVDTSDEEKKYRLAGRSARSPA